MLEYIQRGGGWWQGTTTIAGSSARLDLQQPANPSEQAIHVAADFLQWVQQHEAECCAYVGKQLAAGDFNSNMRRHSTAQPILDGPAILSSLRPAMVVLWPDHAELRYECDALPGGNLQGAHRIDVLIDGRKSPQLVSLLALDFSRRAECHFERPLPADAVDFENSLAEQFIAKAAEGRLRLDTELKGLLDQAIRATKDGIGHATAGTASYLTSVKALLSELAKTPQTIVERVFVSLHVRHPAGKRMPFKQKLAIAPTDRARFDGSGAFPRVELFNVDLKGEGESSEAFTAALRARLQEAATWLAKQSPAVFRDLREAGFTTEAFIHVVAQIETDLVAVNLPPEFLAECGRHGLTMSIATSNCANW
jgi:hypothetical protein